MDKLSNPMHMVTLSPWPLLTSFSLLVLMVGMVNYTYTMNLNMMILGFILIIMCVAQWWRDVIRESTFQGFHNMYIVLVLRFSFILFITSELFFFISFFWSLFHNMLSPSVEIGCLWPPLGIIPLNYLDIPLLNSFILVTSGMTVTVCHHYIMLESSESKMYLLMTLFLGLIFSMFQLVEYMSSSFTMADSIYGSLFFMMTGFHGIHVLVGSLFLLMCYLRLANNHFTWSHHVGFEMASWYWHFVDVVWLFLYLFLYWWS